MQKNSWTLFWQGYRAELPLMVGVAPFGVVFGALATNAGMNPLQALGMSILVIAGSSQFVAAGLLDEGAPAAIIILTTFVINLRHLLYSASVSAFFRPIGLGWKLLIGYLMVDEVYAAAMQRKQQGDLSPHEMRWYFVGAGFNLASLWWGTTLIGVAVGSVIDDDLTNILGFTLPLIFTAIVVPLLVTKAAFRAALSAAIVGVIFAPLPYGLGLIVAAFIGILVGVLSEEPAQEAVSEAA
jgi:4-azaleucine resistance transporter AzlC